MKENTGCWELSPCLGHTRCCRI